MQLFVLSTAEDGILDLSPEAETGKVSREQQMSNASKVATVRTAGHMTSKLSAQN